MGIELLQGSVQGALLGGERVDRSNRAAQLLALRRSV
jgi:hypothetical protein